MFESNPTNNRKISSSSSLRKLHMIEMIVNEHTLPRTRRRPKSAIELNGWLVAAKEVLAGNEGRRGETHGGKQVKMYYSFVDPLNRGEDGRPLRWESIEDLEVE
jgi:hypothetical protein